MADRRSVRRFELEALDPRMGGCGMRLRYAHRAARTSESFYLRKGGGCSEQREISRFVRGVLSVWEVDHGSRRADCTSDEGHPQPRRGPAVHLGLARPHPAHCPLDPTHAPACVGAT